MAAGPRRSLQTKEAEGHRDRALFCTLSIRPTYWNTSVSARPLTPWFALVTSLWSASCFGEGEASAMGTVTEADVIGYVENDLANPEARSPIVGAQVRFFVDRTDVRCDGTERASATVTTDESGAFTLPGVVYGGCVYSHSQHTLCIDHPDFESYRITRAGSARLWHSEKQINITLPRKP